MDIFTIIMVGVPVITIAPFAKMGIDALRKDANKKKAANDLPRLAQQLGLTFKTSRRFDEVGEIEGTYQGYEVAIRPDFFGSVSVRTKGEYPVELDTNAPHQRPDDGMTEFVSGNRDFDALFSQRYASHEAIQRLHANPQLLAGLVALCNAYRSKLVNLKIDEYTVTAHVQEAHAHDADLLATLLGKLVETTQSLDATLQGLKTKDAWD